MDLGRPIILYLHAGSGNHGCEAIADSTVRLIKKIRERDGKDTSLPVILATNSAEEDRRYILGELEKEGLCTIVEERHIDRDFINHVLYYAYRKVTGDAESFLRYRFRDVFRVYEDKCKDKGIKPYEETDGLKPLAVSIGGDNYCYPEMVGDIILAHNVFMDAGFDTVLWGCSIEPDSLKDQELIDDLSCYDRIYARESITYNALLDAGISPDMLELRRDPAFELKTREVSFPKELKKGSTVGINLSPMVLDRAQDPVLVKESYEKFIRYILDTTDQSVMFVPHVIWGHNDDRKPLMQLYEKFRDTGRVYLVEDAPAEILKGYISGCSFFVGARTHSTIAAYSSNVPTLVIGYSVKSRGIAKDLFGTFDRYVLAVQQIEDPDALIKSYKFIMKK